MNDEKDFGIAHRHDCLTTCQKYANESIAYNIKNNFEVFKNFDFINLSRDNGKTFIERPIEIGDNPSHYIIMSKKAKPAKSDD